MPNSSYEAAYTQWLSGHTAPDVYAIDTVQISGEAVGNNYFARYKQDFTATLETSATVTFEPVQFELELPNTQTGSQQVMQVVFPGAAGNVYVRIKRLSPEQRRLPVYLTHRVYLSSDLTKPMINPPTLLQVKQVAASRDAIAMELAAPQWPNRQAGRYYTLENYPGLIDV